MISFSNRLTCGQLLFLVELRDLANKDTGCSVKFEFYINHSPLFDVEVCHKYCMGHTYIKKNIFCCLICEFQI